MGAVFLVNDWYEKVKVKVRVNPQSNPGQTINLWMIKCSFESRTAGKQARETDSDTEWKLSIPQTDRKLIIIIF